MKKVALGLAIAASVLSTSAMASQRPTYLAFAPSAAAASQASVVTPAAPKVAKRSNLEGGEILIPIVGAAAIVGIVIAVSDDSNSSD